MASTAHPVPESSVPESSPAPPTEDGAPALRLDVRSWHAGWAVGVLALAALALLFAGRPPGHALLLALGLLAAAGGTVFLPGEAGRGAGAVAGWSLLTGAALTAAGGVAGPLGPAAAAPALAGLVLGRPGSGVAGACLAAAVASVFQVLQAGAPPVAAPADSGALAAGLVALTALAAWSALGLAATARPEVCVDPRLAAAEAARDRAEQESKARARFIAEMSHELRTPLNAIVGFSDIMRQRLFGPLSDRYGEYAGLIHESGVHLADLINDVLDISKIDAERYELHREVVDARDPVSSALKTLRGAADDKGVGLHASLPSAPLLADVDPRALKQMALNLLSNAVKFTPPGGEVTLSLTAAGDGLELTVADTGVGVAPEELRRLGSPYVQGQAGREVQGTGLGLSLVKALAGLHGGSLVLESRLGEGTAATVRLPVLAPAPV